MFAEIPITSDRTATIVNPGLFRAKRNAYLTSCQSVLIRYPEANPSLSQKVDTSYTIDHPRGSIIAWSIINPVVGYFYECQWEWGPE